MEEAKQSGIGKSMNRLYKAAPTLSVKTQCSKLVRAWSASLKKPVVAAPSSSAPSSSAPPSAPPGSQ